MSKMYRLARREFDEAHEHHGGGWRTIRMSELARFQFAHVVDDVSGPGRGARKGEWYCENTGCAAREVTVLLKPDLADRGLRGDERRMRCPVCGKVMKFHGWLKDVPLLPAGEQPTA